MRLKKFSIITLLAITSLACGCVADKSVARRQVITEFNAGRIRDALNDAEKLTGDEGDFLLGQIMVFTAMAHGGAFSLLKPYYERMVELNPAHPGPFGSGRILAAKVFAQIYLGGRVEALSDLKRICSILNYGAADQCLSVISKDAIDTYVSSGSNMDRVYAMQVSSVAKKLEIRDGAESDFGFGMSLIGVDDHRAISIIHDLKRKGFLDEARLSKYCKVTMSLAAGIKDNLCHVH